MASSRSFTLPQTASGFLKMVSLARPEVAIRETGLRHPSLPLSEWCCQCMRQLHTSSPTQQFRVLKTPGQVSGTERVRRAAVSRSSCPRCASSCWPFPQCQSCAGGDSRWVFPLRSAAPRPPSHGAREVTPPPIPTWPSLPWASDRTAASGKPKNAGLLVQLEHVSPDHRGHEGPMHLNLFLSLALHWSTLKSSFSV